MFSEHQGLLSLSCKNRIIRQFLDRIHGIISTDVEEVADVQLLQDLKQLNIDGLALGGVPVGQLVAAAAQKAGRGCA